MTPAATALAAGHVPSMARSHPDASRPPASHLKGDTDGRSLQLFYLKEKKKKIPTHTRNKTSHEKEFRVALLALCAPWSSLPSPRLGPQRCARPPDSRLDCGQSRVTSSPLHAHRLPVLLRLRAPGLSPGSLCLGRRGAPLRRELCRPERWCERQRVQIRSGKGACCQHTGQGSVTPWPHGGGQAPSVTHTLVLRRVTIRRV